MNDPVLPAVAALVARRWPGAAVTALVHLAGDFSARRYLRARSAGGGAPPTLVVMVLAGSGLPLSSEELCIFPEPPRELPFLDVHRLLTSIGAAVPQVYADDLEAGILLLEDGGDVVLWDRVVAESEAAESLYRRALAALVVLHGPGSASRDRRSIAFTQRFDARLYRWELEHFLEWGVERRLGAPLAPSARAGFETSFAALADELADAELVLSHRDYHSWNILMRGDAPLLIDFQDALLAPPEYDVASLLTDRITPRVVSPAMEARLRAYYWSLRGGVEDGRSRRRYGLVALQRALKVIGRIHYVALAKEKPAPLAFLPEVVATARRFIAETPLRGGLAEQFAALPWPAASGAATP
ncbi:MAG: phosphotransferase [Deltaproteobacteria bacterium]|nr:phosphotransferase [Deltaproteobacteria bacterium]